MNTALTVTPLAERIRLRDHGAYRLGQTGMGLARRFPTPPRLQREHPDGGAMAEGSLGPPTLERRVWRCTRPHGDADERHHSDGARRHTARLELGKAGPHRSGLQRIRSKPAPSSRHIDWRDRNVSSARHPPCGVFAGRAEGDDAQAEHTLEQIGAAA